MSIKYTTAMYFKYFLRKNANGLSEYILHIIPRYVYHIIIEKSSTNKYEQVEFGMSNGFKTIFYIFFFDIFHI